MAQRSPFHHGEQEVQERLGVRDIEQWARRVVRPYLPDDHRAFHTQQPFLVAAARDAEGRPWVTLLVGDAGFVRSPDAKTLEIEAQPVPGDALDGVLGVGAEVGLLGIQLSTRRRNRVNGHIRSNDDVLVFEVEQSFGNCPQYIHEREWSRVEDEPAGDPCTGTRLTATQRAWIETADTFFIASGYRGTGNSPTFGMDASHRGGAPGFIRVEGDTHLVFPDYAGNNHFNTLGNLVLDPRAGLLFLDFANGGMLQLTGRAHVTWEGPALEEFAGARRLVHFDVEAVVELPAALPLRWTKSGSGVRSLRLVEKIRESDDVTSFVFASRDGGALAAFEAGQHLPIELHVPDQEVLVRRTYSLSNAPGGEHYRISVKREPKGLASRHLHDRVEVGEIIDARVPAGNFVLSCTECPVALISAGIGLTPLLSMFHRLVTGEGTRPIWWLHIARDGAHHPLSKEVRELAAAHSNVQLRVAYSRPRAEDRHGVDYDVAGRIDAEAVGNFVAEPDAQYYLCGPVGFMAALQSGLETNGVAQERINTESFGPVG